jgi:hypothetical protein
MGTDGKRTVRAPVPVRPRRADVARTLLSDQHTVRQYITVPKLSAEAVIPFALKARERQKRQQRRRKASGGSGAASRTAAGDTMLAVVRRLGVSERSCAHVFEPIVADLRFELASSSNSRDRRRTRVLYAWRFVWALAAFGCSALAGRLAGSSRRI